MENINKKLENLKQFIFDCTVKGKVGQHTIATMNEVFNRVCEIQKELDNAKTT